jgi:hypothetical protein
MKNTAKADRLFSPVEAATSEDDRLWMSLMRWAYEKKATNDDDFLPMTDFVAKLLGEHEDTDDVMFDGLTESGDEVFHDGSIMDYPTELTIWEEE